jgi:hypothetical protein
VTVAPETLDASIARRLDLGAGAFRSSVEWVPVATVPSLPAVTRRALRIRAAIACLVIAAQVGLVVWGSLGFAEPSQSRSALSSLAELQD